jgi:uncharacterized membrane protein
MWSSCAGPARTLVLIGQNLQHFVFPMVAGFTLLGLVVSVGFLEMSRRREGGLDVSWRCLWC